MSKAAFKHFDIVCLYDDWGLNETTGPFLMEMVHAAKPFTAEFTNPGTVLAYFRTGFLSRRRAGRLLASLADLRSSDSQFARLGIGRSQGKLVVDYPSSGKTQAKLFGGPINDAMRNAAEEARERANAQQDL
jgi:hypothetical protein